MDNIKYAFYENDFVNFVVGYKVEKLVSLSLVVSFQERDEKCEFSDFVANQIIQYFNKERTSFSIPLLLNATPFQAKVYEALLQIPYGETRSYKDIAISINHPKAYRAVGSANNKNPIPIIIPCHRVIASNNTLAGYAYGLDMKKKLLKLEKCDDFCF